MHSEPTNHIIAPVDELKNCPNLLVATPEGEILDIPELAAAVRWGWHETAPPLEEWIPLPDGSDLYLMPRRLAVGYDRRTGERITVSEFQDVPVTAVSAFVAPAYTIHFHCAYETEENAPKLPLYAYCAVAWGPDGFMVPAERVDPDKRQDCSQFDLQQVQDAARKKIDAKPMNRLMQHLMRNCLLTYGCPAARNYALDRWEMPLPTSVGCNSKCFGCISKQPEDGFHESQYRMNFIPTVDEILELAVPHLEQAPDAIASFGQGCEGEPLTNPDLLEEAIRKIRERTSRGTINLNTNGSKPEIIRKLFRAGLDSIRVSLNSALKERYETYYQPVNYTYEDVIQSLMEARRAEKWSSINYLVFPGVTDDEREVRALLELVVDTGLSMIQWRNLNIDPVEYLTLLDEDPERPILGMKWVIEKVHTHFPKLRKGYFNPPVGTRRWSR